MWRLGLLEQHQAESHLPPSLGSCLLKSLAKYWASGLLSTLGRKQIVPFRSARGQCFSNFSHSGTNFMVLVISILFTQYFYKALLCFLKYIYFKRKLHIILNGKTSINKKWKTTVGQRRAHIRKTRIFNHVLLLKTASVF